MDEEPAFLVWATIHGFAESDTTEATSHAFTPTGQGNLRPNGLRVFVFISLGNSFYNGDHLLLLAIFLSPGEIFLGS